MMRWMMAVLLAVATGVAAAQARETTSFRVDGSLLRVGDSEARVHQLLGQPDARYVIESRFGGATGMRWQYYSVDSGYQQHSVSVEISGGEVVYMTSEVVR